MLKIYKLLNNLIKCILLVFVSWIYAAQLIEQVRLRKTIFSGNVYWRLCQLSVFLNSEVDK